jgi:uncharacterized protein YbaA (DUF1428 family)
MYIAGYVIPVPEEHKEAYRSWAKMSAALLKDYGCLEVVEGWEDRVPDGTQTDFRKAVAAKPGEKIVFQWQVWPDKATLQACEAAMQTDPRFDIGDVPFDSRRAILGCFAPLFTMGRVPT